MRTHCQFYHNSEMLTEYNQTKQYKKFPSYNYSKNCSKATGLFCCELGFFTLSCRIRMDWLDKCHLQAQRMPDKTSSEYARKIEGISTAILLQNTVNRE